MWWWLVVVVVVVVCARGEEACTGTTKRKSVSCRWAATISREAARHGVPVVKENEGTRVKKLERVALVYYGPSTLASGDVGLERAVSILEKTTQRKFWWLNTAELEGAVVAYPGELCDVMRKHFDHVVIKSNWDYVVDRFARDWLWRSDGAACEVTRSLQLAGSYPPPVGPASTRFYDVVFVETLWYAATFPLPRAIHAFGVDADAIATACDAARDDRGPRFESWDWLFVGAFADHAGFKRPERLAARTGRRLALGKLRDNADGSPPVSHAAAPVVAALQSAGVVVRDPVPWTDLPAVLASTTHLLVPDDWRGGGERAVLEARACRGVQIVLEPDNPKLLNLSQGPLYSPLYYAGQLESGFLSLEADIQRADHPPTCGLAAASADPAAWCWHSPDFAASVRLDHDLPARVAAVSQ